MNSLIYTSIYKLKNINTLKDIEQWKTKYFNDPVRHSKNHEKEFESLSIQEKNYRYDWNTISDMKCLPFSADGKRINFIEASAHIEYAKRKIFDGNHHFLPKEERTNLESIDIIFFEMNYSFFVLIEESRKKQVDRVLKLIGEKYYEKIEKLDSDFFNWLVYLYSENEGRLNNHIKITSVSGFLGNVLDNENIISSKSAETMNLTATRAFISTGGILREVNLVIDDNDNNNICFKINDESRTVISLNESFPYTPLNGLEKSERNVLYMYTYLLPHLKAIFQEKKDSFQNKKREFAKKIGIEVIREIMDVNTISKKEI